MDIWHYHPTNGRLLGAGVADPHPLEPNAWLIPAFAAAAPPPEPVEGHEIVWEADVWVQREIPAPPPPPEPPPPQPVTDVAFWQFMLAAASLGIVTLAEAEAAVDTRAMPALFAATLDQLPEPQRTMARIKYKGITRVLRSDDLFSLMVSVGATTNEQIDNVFAVAATIT
jgi:hypothetical protein